jgi:hypothetical protein
MPAAVKPPLPSAGGSFQLRPSSEYISAMQTGSLRRTVSSPSSNGSTAGAEAALLEAWRNRQLSEEPAADEVELGPMIGRGG